MNMYMALPMTTMGLLIAFVLLVLRSEASHSDGMDMSAHLIEVFRHLLIKIMSINRTFQYDALVFHGRRL